ncbi:MAG: dihydroorotase, partial [Actinobacteria bacterium]|nr:dihydroorotase [Actinomycetota bacterium]
MSRFFVLKGARDTAGKPVEVIIENGFVVAEVSAGAQHEIIDVKDLVVLPGFVDLHTH